MLGPSFQPISPILQLQDKSDAQKHCFRSNLGLICLNDFIRLTLRYHFYVFQRPSWWSTNMWQITRGLYSQLSKTWKNEHFLQFRFSRDLHQSKGSDDFNSLWRLKVVKNRKNWIIGINKIIPSRHCTLMPAKQCILKTFTSRYFEENLDRHVLAIVQATS